MNPTFLDDAPPAPAGPSVWKRLGRLLFRAVRLLFTDLLRRKQKLRVEVGTPFTRFVQGLFYRILGLPVFLALFVAALVVSATHPARPAITEDPASTGIYYDPVNLLAQDNTRLEGWLVPVVDARRVLLERDSVLHNRYPAIILAHDFGSSRQQMLPLVGPLHEAGYVVLAVNLRGNNGASAASTFGLNEAQDIRAAVEMLRRRPFVDPDAIGVLGVGSGATAALLASQQDPRLHVLVLDHPIHQFDDVLAERIGPRQPWLTWVRPLCKWGFELAFKVNAEEVNLDRFAVKMQSAPVLLLDDPHETASSVRPLRQRQVVDFLKKHLVARPPQTATLLQPHALVQLRTDNPPEDDHSDATPAQSWPPQRTAKEFLKSAGVKD